jgi:hypothetical protein
MIRAVLLAVKDDLDEDEVSNVAPLFHTPLFAPFSCILEDGKPLLPLRLVIAVAKH